MLHNDMLIEGNNVRVICFTSKMGHRGKDFLDNHVSNNCRQFSQKIKNLQQSVSQMLLRATQ